MQLGFPKKCDRQQLLSIYAEELGFMTDDLSVPLKTGFAWNVLNSFHATGLFLYPLKTKNLSFFLGFQGVKKETSGMKLGNWTGCFY